MELKLPQGGLIELIQCIQQVATLKESGQLMSPPFRCIEARLLESGNAFASSPLPRGLPPAELKKCFRTCMVWAYSYPQKYLYCEGIAAGFIPVHHAWLIDRNTGLMHDPTWPFSWQSAYVGFAFTPGHIAAAIKRDGGYVGNIFDDWNNGFPAEKGMLDLEAATIRRQDLPPACLHPHNDLLLTLQAELAR